MVDKNNAQLTNKNDVKESYEYEEFADDDSQEEYELDDTGEEAPNGNSGAKVQLAVLLILIVLLILAGAFVVTKLFKGSSNEEIQNEQPSVEVQENQDINNAFFEENAENMQNQDIMSIDFSNDTEQQNNNAQQNTETANVQGTDMTSTADNSDNANNETQNANSEEGTENNSIVVAWNRSARQNPFKPPVTIAEADSHVKEEIAELKLPEKPVETFQFEIIEPPTKLIADKNIEKLLQTQISGILYDEESPSAIVNFGGRDEFVKVGDEVLGCVIKNITRTKVEIDYKGNAFVASIGELFVPGKLEAENAIPNLNKKFGGKYKQENIVEE